MKGLMKKLVVLFMIVGALLSMTACSTEPCYRCDDTPTRAYKKESTGEKLYYCRDCSSDCFFCDGKAKHHYTSLLGIVFVRDECYEYIVEIND